MDENQVRAIVRHELFGQADTSTPITEAFRRTVLTAILVSLEKSLRGGDKQKLPQGRNPYESTFENISTADYMSLRKISREG